MKPKKFDFSFEDGKLVISADFNQDGEPLLYLKLDATELPDEIVSIFSKKEEKPE